jgi:glycosyltransferase involved in cell wall biosynthesis
MRIAFWLLQDSIRQWSGWVAGLHYVRNCLEALAALPADDVPQIVAFAPVSLREKFLGEARFASAPWLELRWIEDDLLTDLSRRNELEERVRGAQCDLLFPAISPPVVPFDGRCIGWITDLQHKHYPQFFSEAELRHRDQMFSFLSASCSRIVCSSAAVEADLKRFFAEVEDRTFVLRFRTQPPASALAHDPSKALSELGIGTPYVYLPYQFWQHKNHRVVFEAWKLLHQNGRAPMLVCTGATVDGRDPEHFPSLQRFIKEHDLDHCIRILGMVPRDQQWQLYRGASFVLQPSFFEGWSTSVEEARCLGKQVVLSDINVHREQVDSDATFFDPTDANELADVVRQLLDGSQIGHDAVAETIALERNSRRVQRFGRQLLQLFEDTFGEQRPSVSAAVLPLLLSTQNEAAKRMDVIQDLSKHIEQLRTANESLRQHAEQTARPSKESSPSKPNWLRRLKSFRRAAM